MRGMFTRGEPLQITTTQRGRWARAPHRHWSGWAFVSLKRMLEPHSPTAAGQPLLYEESVLLGFPSPLGGLCSELGLVGVTVQGLSVPWSLSPLLSSPGGAAPCQYAGGSYWRLEGAKAKRFSQVFRTCVLHSACIFLVQSGLIYPKCHLNSNRS